MPPLTSQSVCMWKYSQEPVTTDLIIHLSSTPPPPLPLFHTQVNSAFGKHLSQASQLFIHFHTPTPKSTITPTATIHGWKKWCHALLQILTQGCSQTSNTCQRGDRLLYEPGLEHISAVVIFFGDPLPQWKSLCQTTRCVGGY